ncbi:MAG: Gfo/Idh/MocA family oxidoreductase [Verrucomicrobiota bacterium]|jgi:predicted dehydrogenase
MNTNSITRRDFLATSGKGILGVSLAGATASALGQDRVKGANARVLLGLIGAGDRGTGVIQGIIKNNQNVEVKYVCDVNDARGGEAMAGLTKLQGYAPQRINDLRRIFADKDVDAVQISTPEHWHSVAAIWACQAGKDVYVEKCSSTTIWEGRKLVEAAEKYKRIVEIGTQNRSADYGWSARDYIQSGKLGKVVMVKSYNLLGGGRVRRYPDSPQVPKGLDWDAWLGPAPYVPYNRGIHDMNSRGGWGNFWAYSGGILSDDGSHVIDLARLALGDPDHPKSVCCAGGNYAFNGERETPEFQSIVYDFGDFVLTFDSGNATPYLKKAGSNVRYGKDWPFWPQYACRTEIYGTEAVMYLGRHGCGWQVFGPDNKLIAEHKGYFPDDAHQKDFISSIRTRKKPNGDPLQGHLSACLIHLGNISFRVGNKQLLFDGRTERFTNSDEANQLLTKAYRAKYTIPEQI